MNRWKMLAGVALCAIVTLGCQQLPAEENPVTQPSQVTLPAETTLPPETTQPVQEVTSPAVDAQAMEQEAQALQQTGQLLPDPVTVEAPGTLVEEGGGGIIDYSNTEEGYVMVRYQQPSTQRLKVQVKGPTTTYTYNLTPEEWTAFPLSDGEGTYRVILYRNVVDTKYAAVLSLTMEVKLKDQFAPFLHSNQYVNYDAAPKTREKAAELMHGKEDTLDQVAAVYEYVVYHLEYDKELAATVKSGYLPQLDAVLETGKGICFDYAALMTGMLRSRGIPTKLVVGYAGQTYHAWISVWNESTGWIDGLVYFDGAMWRRMDPTFASNAHGDESIHAFIRNEDNYTAKYLY